MLDEGLMFFPPKYLKFRDRLLAQVFEGTTGCWKSVWLFFVEISEVSRWICGVDICSDGLVLDELLLLSKFLKF